MTVAFHCKLTIYSVNLLIMEKDQIICPLICRKLSFVACSQANQAPRFRHKAVFCSFLVKVWMTGARGFLNFSLAPPCRRWVRFIWLHLSDHFRSLEWNQVNQRDFFSPPCLPELCFEIRGKWHPLTTSPPTTTSHHPRLNSSVCVDERVRSLALKLMESRPELSLTYQWEKYCQVLEPTKQKIGPPFIESMALSGKKCVFLDLKCSSVNFHQEETSSSL